MGYYRSLLLAALVASAMAGPTGLKHNCAQTCSDSAKFSFQRGMSYEYTYDVTTSSSFSPKEDGEDNIDIKAKAVVSMLAPCEFSLQINDVNKPELSGLTSKSLRFAFDDGSVTNVCSDPEEQTWALNFKKGFLSAIQNRMTTFEKDQDTLDSDITGECETSYDSTFVEGSESFEISRTKHSDNCSKTHLASLTGLPQQLKAIPLVSTEQECKQNIESGIIQSVDCLEVIMMKEIIGGEERATTVIKSQIRLDKTYSGVNSQDFEPRFTTLEYNEDDSNPEGYLQKVERILEALDQHTETWVEEEVPILFSELVSSLRHLDERQMELIYESNKESRVWRFLIDAAPMVATSSSISIASKLILEGQMTGEEANIWYSSLGLIPSPDVEMFRPLPELLRSKSSKEALFGVGTLIRTYCTKDASCTQQESIRGVLRTLQAKLGTACRSSSLEEKEEILMVLKSLEIAGHWIESNAIESCFSESENPDEIRVAALTTMRSAPCSYDRSSMMSLFSAPQEDSEIRINAYLALMSCPTQELIDNIKDRLSSENVNHLSTFVWSHLSNLQETADNKKQWIRELIGEQILTKKFNGTNIQLSRNFESSFYFGESQFGASMESNLIYSTKSVLPRSGTFGLDVDMFGTKINILEIGARMEGFEKLIEKFFGADGYYPEETIEAILKGLRQKKAKQPTTIEDLLDVVTDEPEGSYFLRIFDKDIVYRHFRGIENFFERKSDCDLKKLLVEFASKGKVDHTKTYNLIDTEIVYSTISGLPLHLKLNGTATVGLRMDGKFEIKSFSDVDVEGHIYPSAAVQMDASMIMKANTIKTGIKITANSVSSTFFDGKVKIEGGKVIDIMLNSPHEQTDLVKISKERLRIVDGVEKPLESEMATNVKQCLPVSNVFGFTVCYAAKGAGLPYSMEMGLSLEKTDSHAGYAFRFLNEKSTMTFLIDTPGSKVDRRISVTAAVADSEIKLDIHTPWKSYMAVAQRSATEQNLSYDVELISDNTKKYQLSYSHEMATEGSLRKFAPVLMVDTPYGKIIEANGGIEVDVGAKSVQISLHSRGQLDAKFTASYLCGQEPRLEIDLISDFLETSLSGSIDRATGFKSQLDLSYRIMGGSQHTFNHLFKFEKAISLQEQTVMGAILLQSSQIPNFGVNGKFRVHRGPGRMEASGSLLLGGDRFDISSDNMIVYDFERESKHLDAQFTLKSGSCDIDSSISQKMAFKPGSYVYESVFNLRPGLKMNSKTEVGFSGFDEGFLGFEIVLPGLSSSSRLSFKKAGEKYYTATVQSKINGNDALMLDGHYRDLSVIGETIDISLGFERADTTNPIIADLQIKADSEGASMQANSRIANVHKFAKIAVKRTIIELDTNIYKTISIKGEIAPEGETKYVAVEGNLDSEQLEISASIAPRSILGKFRFGDIERSIRADIAESSGSLEARLGMDRPLLGKYSFDVDSDFTFTMSLETPFETFEKQDASITFKQVGDNQFDSQMSVTWRNTQAIAISTSTKLDPLSPKYGIHSEFSVTCDEKIFGFGNVNTQFNYLMSKERNPLEVSGIILVTVDGRDLVSGSLKSAFTGTIHSVEGKLITPFTDDITYEYKMVLWESCRSEIHYGNHNIITNAKRSTLPSAGGFKIDYEITSTMIDDCRMSLIYKKDTDRKVLEIEGAYGEVKAMALFNLNQESLVDGYKRIGTTRIITPFMAPITGSVTTSVRPDKEILVDLEFTRFWSSYGNFKLHSRMIPTSLKDFEYVLSVTSPDVRASIDSLFKLEEKNLQTYIKTSYNGIQRAITATGFVDIESAKAKIRGTVVPSDISSIKFALDHEFDSGVRVTNLKIKTTEANYDITHKFKYSSSFDWANSLMINEMLFDNEMTFIDGALGHKLNWIIGDQFIRGDFSIKRGKSADFNTHDVQMNLQSSGMKSSKLNVHFETNGVVYKPTLSLEYGTDKFTLSSVCACLPTECTVTTELLSSFWEPIGVEFAYKKNSPTAIKISFSKGSSITTVDFTGVWNQASKYGSMQLVSSHIKYPIRIEGSFKQEGQDNIFDVKLDANKTYKSKIIFTNFEKLPAKLSIEFMVNEESAYSFSSLLNEKTMDSKIQIGKFLVDVGSSWTSTYSSKQITIDIKSPSKHFEEIFATLEVKPQEKIVDMVLKYGPMNIANLFVALGQYEGAFRSNLSLPGFSVGADISYERSSFQAKFIRGDDKIDLTGSYVLENSVGNLLLTASTTFESLKSSLFDFKYDMNDYNVEFNGRINEHTGSLKGNAMITSSEVAGIQVDIATSSNGYEKLGAIVKYDIASQDKLIEAELFQTTKKISWNLLVSPSSSTAGNILMKAETPFTDFKKFELGMNYSIGDKSVQSSIYSMKNSQRFEYNIRASLGENSLSGEIVSPTSEWKKISVTGNYASNEHDCSGTLSMAIGTKIFRIRGQMLKTLTSPEFEITIETPFESYSKIDLRANYAIRSNEKLVKVILDTPTESYGLELQAKKSYKQGQIDFVLRVPNTRYENIKIMALYNFLSDIKQASMEFIENGNKEQISMALSVDDNKVELNLITPWENFQTISFKGNMRSFGAKKSMEATIEQNGKQYELTGEIDIAENEFKLNSKMPNERFGSMMISGRKTSSGFLVTYRINDDEKQITLDYSLDNTSTLLKLQTPFEGYNNVIFEYSLHKRWPTTVASIKFVKDAFEFSFDGKIKITELQSGLFLQAEIPTLSKGYKFKAHYDFSDAEKTAEIAVTFDDFQDKMTFFSKCDPSTGVVKVSIPFIKEQYGAEYELDVDRANRKVIGSFTGYIGNDVYSFNAHSEWSSQKFEIMIATPFESINRIQASGSMDVMQRTGNAIFSFGPYESTIDASLSFPNAVIEIVTPLEILKHLKLSSSIVNSNQEKSILLSSLYNDSTYAIEAKYVSGSSDKASLIVVGRDTEYKASIEYGLEAKKAFIDCHVKLPLRGIDDVRFTGKIDLTNDDKALELSLQNGEDTKVIYISGKFVGDVADFQLKTPFAGFQNIRTSGALNRSKRSVELSMMNDSALSTIRASFKSLHVDIKSPYASARQSSLHIDRPDAGGIEIHYKRNDVKVDITATPTGRRRSFQVTVDSAVPGWEFLALTGRLDKDELVGYLSGQINEERATISGGGTYSRTDSNLNFDITTPYSGYESLTMKLKFSSRRKQFTYELKSATSNFRIIVKSKPAMIDIYVPNSAEPTIISADISLFKTSFNIKSRFPAVRTFSYSHNIELKKEEFSANSRVEKNGVELFKLDFKRSAALGHLEIEARRGENHSKLHFHREGYEMAHFTFTRNGKEFKVEAQGTGNLPRKGSIDLAINNSFREVPRAVSVHIELDRTKSPKTLKIEATYPGSKLYVFDIKYDINLNRPQVGEYDIRIVTPNRRAYPWQHVAGNWNFSNHDDATVEFDFGDRVYIARGKFGLRESKFVISSSTGRMPDLNVEWRLYKTYTNTARIRDYFIKIGTAQRFTMIKIKGTFSGIEHGDAEFAIQFSKYMRNALEFTLKWHRDSSGLSGTGTFSVGNYNGTMNLKKLKRYAATRSLELSFEATSNIPNFTKLTIEGQYSFNNEAVFKLDIAWDVDKISINFNITDITSDHTSQTANFHLPLIGDVDVTFGHDFRDNKKKTFTMVGHLMGKESHLNAEWTRNKAFTKLSGKLDVESILLGHIEMSLDYDVRNINNANAELQYSRNSDKNIHIKWTRKMTATKLNAELLFESHFRLVPTARVTIEAEFRSGFKLDANLQAGSKQIHINLDIQGSSITGEITTPIPGFELIKGSFVYSGTRKQRTATLHYERGNRVVNMDLNLELPSKNSGSLKLTLETPFEFAKTLSLDASWKNRKGEVHYKRNDISYSFTGAAVVKATRSSFEVNFRPQSGEPIKISFEFDVDDFVSGRGSEPKTIAEFEIELLGKKIAFEIEGMRSSERVALDIEGETNLGRARTFQLKLDSELNTQKRNGLFEVKINDFHFRMRNFFERRANNGYYLRSEMDSSLTPLPGIIIGFGREGEERLLTVGVGEDREISLSFIPKDRMRSGVSGKVSLPRRGLIDLPFDVNYSFAGDDSLNLDFKIDLEPGKSFEGDVVYNSEGVRGRLSSPFTGKRSIRVRRSLSDTGFNAEIGIDEYNIALQGDMMKSDLKKGFVLNGEFLGNKFSVDALLQANGLKNSEGKFLITTTLDGYKSIGAMYTLLLNGKEVHAKAELHLPSPTTPRVTASVDFNFDEAVKGLASVDVSGMVYALQLDISGTSAMGYNGMINLKTPFHVASEVTAAGNFKFERFSKMDLSIDLAYPQGNHQFALNFERGTESTKATLKMNEKTIDALAAYKGGQLEGKVDLTFVRNEPIEVEFNIKRQSLSLSMDLSGDIHSVSGSYDKNGAEITLNVFAHSRIIGGSRMIAFKHEIPSNYRKDSFSIFITYTEQKSHDISVIVDRSRGIAAQLIVDGPTKNMRLGFDFEKTPNEMKLVGFANCPQGVNKFTITSAKLDFGSRTKDIDVKITLESPYLSGPVSYAIKATVSPNRGEVAQTFIKGNSRQHNEFAYSASNNGFSFAIKVETPLFQIERAGFDVDFAFGPVTKSVVTFFIKDVTHSFTLNKNSSDRSLAIILRSPVIPGNVIKCEASATGDNIRETELSASLRFDKKTYATKLEIAAPSNEDMKAALQIKTPIRGYRKMNFMAAYLRTDVHKFILSADKPINSKVELVAGKNEEGYDAKVEIKTPIQGLEIVKAHLEVPLEKIAPKIILSLPTKSYEFDVNVDGSEFTKEVSTNLILDGQQYRGGFGLRTKAPYEFSYFYDFYSIQRKFHVMMDSSVASFFSFYLM